MMMLMEPTIEHVRQIQAFQQEFLDCGDSMDGTGTLGRFDSPEEWIEYANACKTPETVPQGRVPATQYLFLREDDRKIVGMIQIRHYLNEYLEKYGGHIGYSVVPSERRKGYAAQMLGQALPKCQALGINRALITCVRGNEGSRRTILKNGGVYESTVYEPNVGIYLERYWIDIP